ncbi:MAG: ferrous iron transporter B [Elusimicrobia bacterium]|nr:ferrous iron transporter B [Elusimicrobiota bacterium]
MPGRVNKVLLIGNPNVGKSVVFSRLTGVKVIASNYPGTTVEFSEGIMHIDHEDVRIADVPGVYSLGAESRAEEVAVKMLEDSIKSGEPYAVVNVIDATNLERNLSLTLQLIKKRIPMVIALNLWDETQHTGIEIDVKLLESLLGVPCVPTCAITGEGIKELVDSINSAVVSGFDFEKSEKWNRIGEIIGRVQKIIHRHHTLLDRFSEISVRPVTGLPLAGLIALAAFWLIRLIGETLINRLFDPFFNSLWAPAVMRISGLLNGRGLLHDILIGRLAGGEIDFGEAFGILTTGLYVPLAAVLPYIFAFYLVLSLLEDSGYLPRLAVLMDNSMHKVGLHGYGIIPMILGLGCNVPGALSTRIMETKRERFLAATIMAISVPCMAQIAMISGLIGKEGARGFVPVFGTLLLVWVFMGMILNRTLKGHTPELFIEIPPYRVPYWNAIAKKVWMRIVWFIREAVPWVLVGVLLVNLMYLSGMTELMGRILSPVVTGIMGLPPESVGALVVGFLRKDVAVGMLAPLGMTLKQLIIACVVLTMYFPCAATFTVMLREFGLKDMIKATLIMLASTIITGGLLNLIL